MPGSHTHTFTGFSRGALRLLAGLRRNNERAWYAARKDRIASELLEPMTALVADASARLERAKIPIYGDRKRSIFRIYRDIRFSADKTPYRGNLAAYLSYDGGRHTPGGVYVHVEPGKSHLTVAFYRLEAPMLARWRRAMTERPAAFRRVLATLASRGLTISGPEDRDDALVRMPRGFETQIDSDLAPMFRLRSFCVHRPIDDALLESDRVVAEIVQIAKDAKPFLEFGWALQ